MNVIKSLVLLTVPFLFLGATAEKELKCPISKKPAKADIYLEVNGKKVNFCCNNCPKAYAKKINLKGGAEQLAAAPAACPLSGKPGTKENQVIRKTAKLVSFCCGNCLGKTLKENKLAAKDEGPEKCPLSGRPAKAEQSLLVNGESIYFCCGNCRKKFAQQAGITAEVLASVAENPGECPRTGRPARADKSLVLITSELVSFCCGNCKKKYISTNFTKDGQVKKPEKKEKKAKEKKKVRL